LTECRLGLLVSSAGDRRAGFDGHDIGIGLVERLGERGNLLVPPFEEGPHSRLQRLGTPRTLRGRGDDRQAQEQKCDQEMNMAAGLHR
jgi:hypothetical protein